MPVNIHDAKSNLSRLIQQAEAGEEVIIARNGKPVARLVAVDAARPKQFRFGTGIGKLYAADDWDSPATNREIAAEFNDGELIPS